MNSIAELKYNMPNTTYEFIKVILIILFAIAVIIFFPLMVLWAVQTLFPVIVLQYNFYNWAAVLILGIFLRGQKSTKKD